jgi:hypothetical protein
MNIGYIKRETYKGSEIYTYVTEQPNQEACFAIELMKHFAIVCATPDGYDDAGRQKLRLMTEEEVVKRACDMADQAWKAFKSRGWLLELPAPEGSSASE